MTSNTNTVREKILEGLKLTHLRLIQTKKRLNQDLVISRDGKIIRIKSDEL
jgi:hypothetical protein